MLMYGAAAPGFDQLELWKYGFRMQPGSAMDAASHDCELARYRTPIEMSFLFHAMVASRRPSTTSINVVPVPVAHRLVGDHPSVVVRV